MSRRKPNILLITTDTQRCDTLRCMGNPHAISPNLDRLAGEGVLFEQAHTPSPVCSPARCSLLTGLHAPVHGCIENGTERFDFFPTFPDLLKEQGYTNIMVGKTHFGGIPDSFDVVHSMTPKGGEEKRKDGKEKDNPYTRHLKKHGYKQPKAHPNPIPEELYFEAFLVDLTIEEIEAARQRDSEAPFFAYLSMYAPHGPIVPPGQWATLYDGVPLPEINYTEGEVERLPEHLRRLIGVLGEEAAETEAMRGIHEAGSEVRRAADEHRRLYYGYAAYCDAQVGRMLDYLDASGLRDNTLVIFSSDHGHELFDHGVSNKHNYFDSSWRIPLIMSLPGTLPQGETREFAIWNDITASILGAAGTKCDTMQGFDLFTPLAAGEPSPRRCAVGTLYKSAALATRRWKLEYYFEEGEGRLYDRLHDPREQRDVYRHPDFAAVRGEMVEALLCWRSDIADLHSLLAGSARQGGGGPVATRILDHTLAMRGTDAEQRLNVKAMKIDG